MLRVNVNVNLYGNNETRFLARRKRKEKVGKIILDFFDLQRVITIERERERECNIYR